MAADSEHLADGTMLVVRKALAEVLEQDTENVGHFAVVVLTRTHDAHDECQGFHKPTVLSTLHQQDQVAALLDEAVEMLINVPLIGIIVTAGPEDERPALQARYERRMGYTAIRYTCSRQIIP